MSAPTEPVVITLSILGYKLNSQQNALLNYLVPSLLGTLFHITHLAIDLGCVFSQHREGNTLWGGLTVLILYVPVLGSYLLTMTAWESWPGQNCSGENVKYFFKKLAQHLLFPAWNMWRCAEKIFWSIEGMRAENDDERTKALGEVTAPRSIEFYYFLQGFLHTVPQIILQMTLLINHFTDFHQQTNYLAGLSIILNITRMAMTTSLYQRFKTQKVGGRDYPWYKPYKYEIAVPDNEDAVDIRLRNPTRKSAMHTKRGSTFLYCTRDTLYKTLEKHELNKLREKERLASLVMERRRRSSASYLKPIGTDPNVADSDSSEEEMQVFKVEREFSNPYDREPDQIDFPRPIRFVSSIPEDDLVGKLVAFLWWFMFLAARFLSIVTFAVFYPRHIIWILTLHFLICVGYLLYDVQTYIVRKTKAVFFVFIGAIYIFCIIEFKKKFKKYNKVYNAYCALVFGENLIMSLVWWNVESDRVDNEWWLNYVFYTVIGSTVLGVMSLLLYTIVNRPEKVVIATEVIAKR